METLCRIRDIYRAIAEFEVKFMQEFDLSLNEGMLLCTLLNTPKLTSSEIAEALGLSASNTSKVIRSVEDKKLITRLVGKTDKKVCQNAHLHYFTYKAPTFTSWGFVIT